MSRLGLLFLHALPLDGSMWQGQMDLLPGASIAPTLYAMGDSIEAWADSVLKLAQGDRLIVVGCSVGGSCAIEVAHAAPDRIAALVLIGTKAAHRPEPDLHATALQTLRDGGMQAAWDRYWLPLFSPTTDRQIIAEAKRAAFTQPPQALARGITAFHTRPSRDGFLATCRYPVIVVTGADDAAPGPETSAKQAAAAPLGSFHLIEACGHYVPLERPQALKQILRHAIGEQR